MEKLKHVELMEDNNIALIDLPKEIKNKINALKPTIARYNNSNPPSEKLKQAIIKQDIGIAELIADYIEKDLPDSDEDELDEDNTPPVLPAVVAPIIEEVKEEPVIAPVIIEPVVIAPIVEERKAKYPFGTLEMENQILEECKANGYISSEKLAKIIGKSEWGLSVSSEDVFSISLKKTWQTKFYKLV